MLRYTFTGLLSAIWLHQCTVIALKNPSPVVAGQEMQNCLSTDECCRKVYDQWHIQLPEPKPAFVPVESFGTVQDLVLISRVVFQCRDTRRPYPYHELGESPQILLTCPAGRFMRVIEERSAIPRDFVWPTPYVKKGECESEVDLERKVVEPGTTDCLNSSPGRVGETGVHAWATHLNSFRRPTEVKTTRLTKIFKFFRKPFEYPSKSNYVIEETRLDGVFRFCAAALPGDGAISIQMTRFSV